MKNTILYFIINTNLAAIDIIYTVICKWLFIKMNHISCIFLVIDSVN